MTSSATSSATRRLGLGLLGTAWVAYLLVSTNLAIRLLRREGEVLPSRLAAAPETAGPRHHTAMTIDIRTAKVHAVSPLDKTEFEGRVSVPAERFPGTASERLRISLVFDGPRATYEVPTHRRPAVQRSDADGARTEIRFSTVLIPVKMRPGAYRVGLRLDEGPDAAAFEDTGLHFLQDRRGWRMKESDRDLSARSCGIFWGARGARGVLWWRDENPKLH